MEMQVKFEHRFRGRIRLPGARLKMTHEEGGRVGWVRAVQAEIVRTKEGKRRYVGVYTCVFEKP